LGHGRDRGWRYSPGPLQANSWSLV
jgi:hypothetical protein